MSWILLHNRTYPILKQLAEDWKKGVDITEEKFKEVIQLPPITLENCHEREDGDLQWDEITFEEEVNGKYWHLRGIDPEASFSKILNIEVSK